MDRMRVRRRFLGGAFAGVAALVAAGGAGAQSMERDGRDATDADLAFAALRAEVPGLRANWNFETGFPSFIYGKPIDIFGAPQSDAEFEAVARNFVDVFSGLFGFDSSVLVTEQVKHLDLSRIGTTDKTAVGFSQQVGGVPVKSGGVSMLFNADGSIVGIENHGLPNVDSLELVPAISESQATVLAINEFGHPGAHVLGIEFAIVADAAKSGPALAWIVELGGIWDETAELPIQEKIEVDAHDGGIIRSVNVIHTFTDLIGQTRLWASPGTLPDTSYNPVAKFRLQRGAVDSPVGNTNTDLDGEWTITYGGSSNQTVTWNFDSTSLYGWVDDQGGADYTKSKSITPGVKNYSGLNQKPTEYNTGEANGQKHQVGFREWVVAIDPTDTKMDFRQRANVNQNSSCNAYYNGSSTNYYRKKGGCNNTCYSTVVSHEVGHWANDKYNSGNGGDGFGEGAADTWAMYIHDTPIVGEDFFTGGGDIRDGRNTRQYCGSCAAGCYGEVHADGEVLMGALWKVRDQLNISLGDAAGDAVADDLYLRWFQSYNASTICDTNETQLLTLDDDNGDIDDGTPHSTEIETGFELQGYPGYY